MVALDGQILPHTLQTANHCAVLVCDKCLGILPHFITESGEKNVEIWFFNWTHNRQTKNHGLTTRIDSSEKSKKEITLFEVVGFLAFVWVVVFLTATDAQFNKIVIQAFAIHRLRFSLLRIRRFKNWLFYNFSLLEPESFFCDLRHLLLLYKGES